MNLKKLLFVGFALAFALVSALVTHARMQGINAFGKNAQNICVSAQTLENDCSVSNPGSQCHVMINGQVKTAWEDSECTELLRRP